MFLPSLTPKLTSSALHLQYPNQYSSRMKKTEYYFNLRKFLFICPPVILARQKLGQLSIKRDESPTLFSHYKSFKDPANSFSQPASDFERWGRT